MTFDLDFVVKVTRNVAKFHLHHVTYAHARFEIATCEGFVGDAFTRIVTENHTHARTYAWTDGRTTDGRRTAGFGTKVILTPQLSIIFIEEKKSGSVDLRRFNSAALVIEP